MTSPLVNYLILASLKGDVLAIKIPEEEYRAGLESCKNHLHGRLIHSKGDAPININDLRPKLLELWKPLGLWGMVSLGKGFFEFSFSSSEELQSVWTVGSWYLKLGVLRLSSWNPDFNPNIQKQTHAQCWVRILGLPREYWRPKIIFIIAGGLGTPIALDEATNKESFGHFARYWLTLILMANFMIILWWKEKTYFAFFVGVEYEKLPLFCTTCQNIGHTLVSCKKNQGSMVHLNNKVNKEKLPSVATRRQIYVPKNKGPDNAAINVSVHNQNSAPAVNGKNVPTDSNNQPNVPDVNGINASSLIR